MKNVFSNIAEAIGNTPLIKINRLNPNPNVTIYVKLESRNPGGSIKDRPALKMIEAAEKSGDLKPGKIIIEATSGNTGIGLAMVAAVKGYRIILAMSELASIERQRILKALGAEIMLTPGNLGTDGAIEEVYRLVRENPDKYFLPDQFNNPNNPAAHVEVTGPEIYEQTDGKVDMIICGLGTSGTAMGLLKSMKSLNPKIQVVGIEPYPGHKIQGMKNMKESYVPGIFDRHSLDQVINIKDEDAFEMARRLAREEGIFVGMSSGCAVYGAIQFANKMEKGIIVAIAPDSGERYLSTNLFTTMLEPDFSFYNFPVRKKVQLKPLREGKIRISITRPPLDQSLTLEECRRFLTADILARFLKSRNFAVKTATVIPDWDVSTIQSAFKKKIKLPEFTDSQINEIKSDFDFLNISKDFLFLKTSKYEDNILSQARKLLNKRHAYETMRSLYFDLSQFKNYGELSNIDLEKIRIGSTVDLSTYEKQNPRDFTLLKRATLAELKQGVYLKTDWGNVLPTLHIATAAATMAELGNPVDIHVSNVDFLFPHLENTNAIAQALTGKPFASLWMLCEKISSEKERDETCRLSLKNLRQGNYNGKEIRYWLLSNHYRKPANFSGTNFHNAVKGYHRLIEFYHRLQSLPNKNQSNEQLFDLLFLLEQKFFDALSDDLNTPQALSVVFKFIREVNLTLENGEFTEAQRQNIINTFQKLDLVLGIFDSIELTLTAKEEELLKQREAARQARNWKEADKIREDLAKSGIIIKDTASGTVWERQKN